LEEVARELEKMPFGTSAESFASYVRNMKQWENERLGSNGNC
jgi:hypothetical protein